MNTVKSEKSEVHFHIMSEFLSATGCFPLLYSEKISAEGSS